MWSLAAELAILAITISVCIYLASIVLSHSSVSVTVCNLAKCYVDILGSDELYVKVVDEKGNLLVEYGYLYIYDYGRGNYTLLRLYIPTYVNFPNVSNKLIVLVTPTCVAYNGTFKLDKPIYVTLCGLFNHTPSTDCEPIVQCLGNTCNLTVGYQVASTCPIGGETGLLWIGRLVKLVLHR